MGQRLRVDRVARTNGCTRPERKGVSFITRPVNAQVVTPKRRNVRKQEMCDQDRLSTPQMSIRRHQGRPGRLGPVG